MLGKAGLGFTPSNMESGTTFVQNLVNSIWYADPHIEKMATRSCHLPMLFESFIGYNNPDRHKHKQTDVQSSILLFHAQQLDTSLEKTWINGPMWLPIKTAVMQLSEMLHKYANYLIDSAKTTKENAEMTVPVRNQDDTQSVQILYPKYVVKPTFSSRYKALVDHIAKTDEFVPVVVDEYTPPDTRQRRYYVDNLSQGIPYKCILYRVSAGNNLVTHNFLWRIPNGLDDETVLAKNTEIIQKLTHDMPTYHTRAMRRQFVQKAALICNVKSMHARQVYRLLTGDSSASTNEVEKNCDIRVQQAFDLQDPDVIMDLREHSEGRPPKYSVCFDKTKTYLENVVEAADERRHDIYTHLASAISVRDLLQQVAATCAPETPIPSEQWLRLQFAPKVPSAYSSLQYTGNLKVKFQVQSRQLRKEHMDCHYASAVFHYQKVMAVRFRKFCTFVCMDDKHHCKVGEPGHPVAAVDRGKRVIVGEDKVFAVSDHDFTKFSIIPSVTMLLDIPDNINGSFYRGQIYVGIKDLILEPSSPLRHVTELFEILKTENAKPILFMYTDGGPDHRLTYLSVQLALVCLFIAGDYDMLVAARTPPMSSWKKTPERIMSILNLALQCVGLMRSEASPESEKKLKSASGIKKLREIAVDPELKKEMVDSIEPVKVCPVQ